VYGVGLIWLLLTILFVSTSADPRIIVLYCTAVAFNSSVGEQLVLHERDIKFITILYLYPIKGDCLRFMNKVLLI
jgi:hypothetical protein